MVTVDEALRSAMVATCNIHKISEGHRCKRCEERIQAVKFWLDHWGYEIVPEGRE